MSDVESREIGHAPPPVAIVPLTEPYKKSIYDKFVKFCSMPDPDKCEMLDIPKGEKGVYLSQPTMAKFAEKFGVARSTLIEWKKRPEFMTEVDRRQSEWGLDLVPNVLASLYRRCVKYGMAYDVETFLAYYKKWDRKRIASDPVERFDMNDIRAMLAVLPKDKQDEFYALISRIIGEAELPQRDGEVQADRPVESGVHS